MAEKKKHSGGSGYYVLGVQLGTSGTLFGIPGDHGLLLDTLKVSNIRPSRLDQLKRLYHLEPWRGTQAYECQCGIKFATESDKMAHARRRHKKHAPAVKDLSECTEEERAQILADLDQYETSPNDFNVPDPEDREMNAVDQQMERDIDWTKTQATNQS